jgi:predicted nuclease of predicted toxin-antitoxin system
LRILFDENVPAPLRQFFPDCEVETVQERGWAGVENGKLLELAEANFDVLVLADKNLRYQQDLTGRSIAILELPTNRWPLIQPLGNQIAARVRQSIAGQYVVFEFTP